jgi:hypothetical protein
MGTPSRSPLGAFYRSPLGVRDRKVLGWVPNGRYNDIAYGNGKFAAVGYGDFTGDTGLHGAIFSPNAKEWSVADILELYAWECVGYKDGWFVALGVKIEQWIGGSPYYEGIWSARSRNGQTWTDIHCISDTLQGAFGIVHDGNRFFAICVNGTGGLGNQSPEYPAIASSVDGASWSVRQISNTSCPRIHGFAYGNGRFVASAGHRVYVSTNGDDWSEQFLGFYLRPIVYGNGLFVAASNYAVKHSSDGFVWNDGTGYGLATGCMGFHDGRFVALEKWRVDGHHTRRSDDGIAWTTGVGNRGYWGGVCHGQGKFVAAGSGFHSQKYGWRMIQYSPDGINWESPRQEGDPNP